MPAPPTSLGASPRVGPPRQGEDRGVAPSCPSSMSDEMQPVAHEGVGAEDAEQQQALKGGGEVERQLEQDLRAFGADEGERQRGRGAEDAEGVQQASKAASGERPIAQITRPASRKAS